MVDTVPLSASEQRADGAGPAPTSGPVHRPRVPLRIEEAVCALAMGLICLISFGNVVVRYLTNYSFAFTEEYSVFLLVVMTFAGSALAFATGSHIRISYLVDRMPRPAALACEALAILATTIMFALIVYYGGYLALDEWRYGERSPGLGYPRWIYTVWLPILSVVILMRVAGYAWRVFRHAAGRDEATEHGATEHGATEDGATENGTGRNGTGGS